MMKEVVKVEREKNAVGIYIHIPFCERKCEYCDFLSFQGNERLKKEYIEALIYEIKSGTDSKSQLVQSVFFGGGTPSIIEGSDILRIMETVREVFVLTDKVEITIEVNPGTLTAGKLEMYRKAGINRLSIGLQSANNRELKLLGRIHSYEKFIDSYELARKYGFKNVNIDLMSALPGQTIESWRNTLKTILSLRPEHISAYSLIIEEGTPFYERYADDVIRREEEDEPKYLPTEEEERQMYYETNKILREAGYERYEISNYSREGYECVHNCSYWNGTPYIGFGIGASSLYQGNREKNTEDIHLYIEKGKEKGRKVEEREKLSKKSAMEEFMFLGLRMMRGVSKLEFKKRFHITMEEIFGDYICKLGKEGLIEESGEYLKLSEKGIDVSNYVFTGFLLEN
jgi:oxygen-independent coproporphyrinogen-3 oxidase